MVFSAPDQSGSCLLAPELSSQVGEGNSSWCGLLQERNAQYHPAGKLGFLSYILLSILVPSGVRDSLMRLKFNCTYCIKYNEYLNGQMYINCYNSETKSYGRTEEGSFYLDWEGEGLRRWLSWALRKVFVREVVIRRPIQAVEQHKYRIMNIQNLFLGCSETGYEANSEESHQTGHQTSPPTNLVQQVAQKGGWTCRPLGKGWFTGCAV